MGDLVKWKENWLKRIKEIKNQAINENNEDVIKKGNIYERKIKQDLER